MNIPTRPALIALLACAAALLIPSACAHARESYGVELLCDGGRPCPETRSGRTRWVMGELGERYTIRVTNRTARWVEAVITVDGRDVVNGTVGSYSNRGYLIAPWDSVDVEGFRVSTREVAAFRFTTVPDSYAGRVDGGPNAGVVGVAFFPERERRRREPPEPMPLWDHRDYRPDEDRSRGAAPGAESAPRTADKSSSSGRTESRSRGGATVRQPTRRQNLGTQYGERRSSSVNEVEFTRANPQRPARVVSVRYDDRRGLFAHGIEPPRVWVAPPPRATRFVPPPPDPFPTR
ncbi:MAG: hypothetical protein H6744_10290 [Deltaproteobacteria bacterium]|nr:hypothetical protein [Deltaproteobacteria bacterium]MCB9787066.1 hypothetical protein [Deltaproteobacteria bacterium]